MSKNLRNLGLAALFAVSASAMMSGHASALSMADCSAKYKAAKAAGTDAGMKWNDFRKAQCSTDAAAAPAPVAPAATAAKAATTAAPAAPAAPAVAAATPSGSFMKDCSASWKSMKAANTVPAGMKWKDFVAAKCQVSAAAAPAAPAATPVATAPMAKGAKVAPPEPSATPDTSGMATADKNGKPYTPGQMAAHKRIKACGESS